MNRDALRWGLGCFLVLRIITSLAAWASPAILGVGTTVVPPGYVPPEAGGLLAGGWLRADALWYLKIASSGYGPEEATYAFFPLFPLLVSAATPLSFGNELYAALLVSNVACAAGLVALYAFFVRVAGKDAARAGVAAFALFPTSFFLVAPYAEPVLLTFGAAALLAAAAGRYGVAVVLGALAAVSRPFGFLLAIPLLAIGWRKKGWWAGAGPVAGLAGWIAWVWLRTGDPFASLSVQEVWQRSAALPWTTLVEGFRAWGRFTGTEHGPFMLIDIVAVAAGLAIGVGGALFLRRRKGGGTLAWATLGYTGFLILIPMAVPFPGRPLMSIPRFLLAAFPSFVAFVLLPKSTLVPLAALSATGLFLLTSAFVAARPIF